MIAAPWNSLAFTLANGIGLPIPASTSAVRTDVVWNLVFWVSVFFFVLVMAIMVYFIVKYRRRPGQKYEAAATHNAPLEIAWTLTPIAVTMLFFVLGLSQWIYQGTPPSDSYQIDVSAHKWAFNFSYPTGAQSTVLYVPEDTPVLLNLTSQDVLHGCYIPAFRLQKNFVPGRTEHLWFNATVPTPKNAQGEYEDSAGYPLFCNQYCGEGHSFMHTQVVVMDKAAFEEKLVGLSNIFLDPQKHPLPLPVVGKTLYGQLCFSCHTIDGSAGTGPTWKGLYGSQVTLTTGETVTANEAYLKESILDAAAQVVKGFTPVMPNFDDQLSGSPYKDMKRQALIAYIMSLSEKGQADLPAFEAAHPVPGATGAAPAPAQP